MSVVHMWRGDFTDAELEALHAEGFGHEPAAGSWWERVNRHSLGWVTARDGAALAGFVNVAWDGGAHAFVLDTVVAGSLRRRGVGAELVTVATVGAKAAGCEWLHVDFEEHLTGFYLEACGFTTTGAGLIRLR